MRLLDTLLSLLIPGLVLLHLIVAPYTKVEESFNIQAAHDVLVYGVPTKDVHRKLSMSYDHFTFPGAVPRTFVGPVLLSGIVQHIVAFVGLQHAQFLVRAVLGLANAAAMLIFMENLARAYGRPVARWYAVLQASQFHVIFYASRTLPNMFAFALTTLASAQLLPQPDASRTLPRQRLAISLFVFAGVVFRSEVALLLATNALFLLAAPMMPLEKLIPPFIISFIAALVASVPIDSYFWQKPLWPELWGFYYNAILGSSSNWGVSPWYYYFTSALPRLLMNPLAALSIALALRQPATRRAAAQLLVPGLLFVAIYSLQPHKETRFIFYVVPPMTAAAALGASFVFSRRGRGVVYAATSAALVLSVLACLAASSAMLMISSLNYPGGEALAYLRAYVAVEEATTAMAGGGEGGAGRVVSVHADVLACMTGVTLFGTVGTAAALPSHHTPSHAGAQAGAGGAGHIGARVWAPGVSLALDKTEDEAKLKDGRFWTMFDYLIVEDVEKVRGGQWDVIGVVQGYAGVEILRPGEDGGDGEDDVEKQLAGVRQDEDSVRMGKDLRNRVVGRGKLVKNIRRKVRRLTGGWWVGPRMAPRLLVLRRVKGAGAGRAGKTVAS